MADAGSSLLFKFRSGIHGLNEELGRHRGNKECVCVLCGNECESVRHVLWECSAYSSSRADFLFKLQEKLGATTAKVRQVMCCLHRQVMCHINKLCCCFFVQMSQQ